MTSEKFEEAARAMDKIKYLEKLSRFLQENDVVFVLGRNQKISDALAVPELAKNSMAESIKKEYYAARDEFERL